MRDARPRSPRTLIGRTLDELGLREDAGIDADQRLDLAAGRIPRYEVERRLSGPAGTSIPVLVSVSLTTRARRRAAADLIVHVQDLRERRRAERDREQLIRAQAARAQAEAASERLRLMQSIAVAALGAEDLEELLREVLDTAAGRARRRPRGGRADDGEEPVLARAANGVEMVVERGGEGPQRRHPRPRLEGQRGPVAVLDAGQ